MKRITNYKLMLAAVGAAFFMNACKGDDDVVLPPIGGYANSDAVAAANLVARISFENNTTDSKSGLVGTATNVNYAVGKKGQAWQGSGTQARYAIYTAPSTFASSLSSYSIAFWMNSDTMKLPLGVPTQGRGAQGIFSIVDAAGFWGGMNLFIENRNPADNDTLRLKLLTRNVRAGVTWQDQGPIVRIPNARNTWVHVVLTYDATASRYSAYINGTLAAKVTDAPYAPANVGYPGSYIQYANDPGGIANPNAAPLYGVVQLPVSTQFVIGSFQFTTTPALNAGGTLQPWATNFAGQLDEFRVYKSGLVAADVNALYQLELAGR